MGCEGVTGLSGSWGAGLGLPKGNGGLLDPLGHSFALGLRNEAVGISSLMIWVVAGLGVV